MKNKEYVKSTLCSCNVVGGLGHMTCKRHKANSLICAVMLAYLILHTGNSIPAYRVAAEVMSQHRHCWIFCSTETPKYDHHQTLKAFFGAVTRVDHILLLSSLLLIVLAMTASREKFGTNTITMTHSTEVFTSLKIELRS